MRSLVIYLAGPLFTQAEWQWNAHLAGQLRSIGFNVILPQERALPMLQGSEKFSASTLFAANVRSLDEADVILANLDGADADSGTCWECGYAFKAGVPILGIRTDVRQGGDAGTGVNLMLLESCRKLITVPPASIEDTTLLIHQIRSVIAEIMGNA